MEIYIHSSKINERIEQLGSIISDNITKDKPLVVLSVLKGALMFTADLIRKIEAPIILDFLRISSYQGEKSTGVPQVKYFPSIELRGAHILLIDDILDTGLTLHFLHKTISQMEPASLKTCVLLDKPARRQVNFHADFVGFEIDDHFVVGYGLDYNEHYRHLPHILRLPENK